ncbi:hypothetical protein DAPPUDRAFT_307124 [Daphnia pulex]|uniref:NACHT domain-containing protein n=1 Tax=Daphnia pulex TaxID=6669 RepID=E9G0X8_DAPPU|nr:hypothetical protein DAPPUDRAFT_307124 [Daphnia pulex]|eukprot:EFX87323.1 hypothetical protein DAPPUDRAFT_307124 [Daphnia pulex]
MTHKRRNTNEDTCPTLVKKSRRHQPSTSVSSLTDTTREEAAQGLRKTNHGIIFQLKLLMLFLIRGIEAGYMFQLGTEMEQLGGKFDDLIFKYQVKDNTPAGKHYRYRYLQAKHKQNESFQITAAQLLNDNEGNFSLPKYFRSYCDIISRGEDIEDCIICTNVGFNEKNLEKNGIQLASFKTKDKMLTFGKHSLNHYKIKVKSNHKLYAILQAIEMNDPIKNTSRNVTRKEIETFFEKLVFVANAPNEVVLGRILTDEVGKYYNIERIWTRLPTRTAVKVIEALKELGRNITNKIADAVEPHEVYFQRKDSYLMTSFAEKKDHKKFKTLLKASDLSHNLLIFVCDNEPLMEKQVFYEKLVNNSGNKKVIFISQGDAVDETKEDLTFADLSAKFKKILLSKKVLFQGSCLTVENLITRSFQTADHFIESGASEIMNSNVIEELIKKERLEIASFTSSRFEKSLYIKRQLTSAFPFDNSFWGEVAKELGHSTELLESKCRISLQGEIEWFVIGEEKTKIWEKINIILDKRKAVQPSKTVAEDDLVNNKNHKEDKPDVVIISGVAGSGKSSILSHYYEVIKEKKPEHWVIVISLTDHSEAFSKLKSTEVNKTSVTDFLLNLAIVDRSPFTCSLLKHRLETGDRMVIMLDGFDESHHQETVIEMIKIFKKMQLNGLFVTTRSHMTSQIQLELSQLSYSLSNFSKRDQVEYLTSVWQRDFRSNVEKDLRNCAKSLVDRVSKTLRDEERAFIGIPLQCRILAECFQSELLKSFQQDNTFGSFSKTIQHLNLSLASLYRLLMEKKHEIYRQEKKAQSCASDLASSHAMEDIDHLEPFLRKLAIETIVSFNEHVDALLGKKKSMTPKETLDKKKERMVDHCSRFGLLDRDAKGKVRFLHRTYAEYLMAEYLYTGFLLDEEKRNHLLIYKSARKFIVSKILVKNHYDGVQIFLDSMLKEMVDDNEEWRNRINQRKLPDGLH